jgi:hypothetical protein
MLARVGATRATALTGCCVITSRETWTAARATGCDCTNAVAGTAVTAPGASRLR